MGSQRYRFSGGRPELREYLLAFFGALRADEAGDRARGAEVRFASADAVAPPACAWREVAPGVLRVGTSRGAAVFDSPGSWTVRVSGAGVRVALRGAEAWRARRDVLNQALSSALALHATASGAVSVHAACIQAPWGVALLCGASGAGKSTLALGAAAAGASLVSDDRVFLAARDGGVAALGAPVTFRAGTSVLVPALAPWEADAPAVDGDEARHRWKIAVEVERAFGAPRRLTAPAPRAVVLLARDDDAGDGVWRRATAGEARSGIVDADPSPLYPAARDGLIDAALARMEAWSFSYAFGGRGRFESTVRRLLAGPPG